MSSTLTGGPAFPVLTRLTRDMRDDFSADVDGGMTLRDYFAGQALAGAGEPAFGCNNVAELAAWAYSVADAMLKERAK